MQGLDGYIALLRRCWAQMPLDRPGFDQIAAELRRATTVLRLGAAGLTRCKEPRLEADRMQSPRSLPTGQPLPCLLQVPAGPHRAGDGRPVPAAWWLPACSPCRQLAAPCGRGCCTGGEGPTDHPPLLLLRRLAGALLQLTDVHARQPFADMLSSSIRCPASPIFMAPN